MRIESWVGAFVVLLGLFAGLMAADEQQCRRSPLPANVRMPCDLERVMLRIYDRSPAFRAQCERIASADTLRVTVLIDSSIPSRCRAFTIVRRQGYEIRAEMHVPPSNALTELIAHEFEHVIEQIEGLDLKRLARVKRSGVYTNDGRIFETDRAQAAGRAVAAEARRRENTPAAD